MIFKINRLRNLLNEQLNENEINWEVVKELSKELDSLLLEYRNIDDSRLTKDKTDKEKDCKRGNHLPFSGVCLRIRM